MVNPNYLRSASPQPDQNYYQLRQFTTRLDGEELKFTSKPGIPNWKDVTPATILLAGAVQPGDREKMLLLGCAHGALGVALARRAPGGTVWLADPSFIALRAARATLALNSIPNAQVLDSPLDISNLPSNLDKVILSLPKGRQLARRWMVEAYRHLKPGGEFFLAGENRSGVQSATRDSQELFGNSSVLGYKKGNRVVRMVKREGTQALPEWASQPGIFPGTWMEFQAALPGCTWRFSSLPGIFSADHLDEGTDYLVQNLEITPSERVLDLGCGYGVIGLHAAYQGAASTDLIDENLLALEAARKNANQLGLNGVSIFPSDLFSAVERNDYNLVISNPPFHVGQKVDYLVTQALIDGSYRVLAPRGKLVLVANRFIRYASWVQQVFPKAEILAQNNKYQVIVGIK